MLGQHGKYICVTALVEFISHFIFDIKIITYQHVFLGRYTQASGLPDSQADRQGLDEKTQSSTLCTKRTSKCRRQLNR
jgi:hypothetical protein